MSDLWEDLLSDIENLDVSPARMLNPSETPASGPTPRHSSSRIRPSGGATRSFASNRSPRKASSQTLLVLASSGQQTAEEPGPSEASSPATERPARQEVDLYGGALPVLMTSQDPERNRHRWYAFRLQQSFFGDLSVVCSWGGIGQNACGQKAWRAVDEAEARKRIHELMAKRQSRGYRLLEPSEPSESIPRHRGAAL